MEQQNTGVTVDDKDDSSIMDCYRIAVDFGMSAALKAYEKLQQEHPIKDEHEISSN